MHKVLISAGILAACGALAMSRAAAAQGFGQVTFGAAPATPASATPAPDAKPAGKDVSGVTVTGKKSTATDFSSKELVCHSEPVLGSLFPNKVCATRGELALRRQNDQEVARRFESGLRDGQGNTH